MPRRRMRWSHMHRLWIKLGMRRIHFGVDVGASDSGVSRKKGGAESRAFVGEQVDEEVVVDQVVEPLLVEQVDEDEQT